MVVTFVFSEMSVVDTQPFLSSPQIFKATSSTMAPVCYCCVLSVPGRGTANS